MLEDTSIYFSLENVPYTSLTASRLALASLRHTLTVLTCHARATNGGRHLESRMTRYAGRNSIQEYIPILQGSLCENVG